MTSAPTTPTRTDDDFTIELGTVLATGERPPRPSAIAASSAFGWRGIRKIRHVPEQLLDATVTPVLFLLMFTYLFGGAVAGSTDAYLEYIFPGILAQSVLFTSVYSGVALNTDMTKGVVDRFRTLPIWKPAPLAGAVIGDSVRFLLAGTVSVIVALALGYSPDNGLPGLVAGVLLVVLFAFALSWAFTTLGLVLRSQNAVMNTGFMLLFPLLFLSNIFVDPSTLPSWLEAFVDVNPMSHLVTATRGLMDGGGSAEDILLVLGEAAVLVAIFAPLTVRLYRKT